MIRDMDLIRALLLRAEGLPAGGGSEGAMAIEGRDFQLVWYHVRLAAEGGLLDVKFLSGSSYFHVNGLTWEGHDFLEKARNETIWDKAKQLARSSTGGVSIEVVKAILTDLALHAARLK